VIEVDFQAQVGPFQLAPRLRIEREIVVLFGPSGAGKSLTLEAIAGLLRPRAGRIALDGRVVFDATAGIDVPPHARHMGYLVQEPALFPHLSVADNIAYGLHHLPRAERRRRVEAFVRLLGLEWLERRRPAAISGGQRQRVALARALAREPKVLLLDEPLAALDASVRTALRSELRRFATDLGLSVLLVTHDLSEAYNLGDRIAVMDAGRVLQCDARAVVLSRPASVRVAELMSVRNVLAGRVVGQGPHGVEVATALGVVVAGNGAASIGERVHLAVRAERVILERRDRPPRRLENRLAVSIVSEAAHGATHTLYLRVDGVVTGRPHDLEVDIPSHPYDVMGVARERAWHVSLPAEAVHLIHDG